MYYLWGEVVNDNDFALAVPFTLHHHLACASSLKETGNSYLSSKCSPDSQMHPPAIITGRVRVGNRCPFLMRREREEQRHYTSTHIALESTELALLMHLSEKQECAFHSRQLLCPSAGERKFRIHGF